MKKSTPTAIPHNPARKNSLFSQAYKKYSKANRIAPPLVENPNDRKKNTFGVIYVGAQPSGNNNQDEQKRKNIMPGNVRVVGHRLPDSLKPKTGTFRMHQKPK